MDSPPSSSSRPSSPLVSMARPKRLQSFRRLNASEKEGRDEEESPAVQVLIPDLAKESNVGDANDTNSRQDMPQTRTLLISATGQCTTKTVSEGEDEAGDAGKHPTEDDSAVDNSSFGAPSLRGCINSCFLWLKKQTRPKQIAAPEAVLATYHDSFLYGEVSLTTNVRAAIRGGRWNTALLLLEFFAALFSICLYVRSTYTSRNHHWITIGQIVCSSFFLADYVIKLYCAPVRLYYVLSLNGFIDLISTLPIYFIIGGVMSDAAIPEVFLIFRVMRAFPLLSSGLIPGGAVSQEIFLLVMYTLGVLFIAGGVLQWVELIATPESVKKANGCTGPSGCMTFYDGFYFIVVTVSTVGYGDITLNSNWGRFIALLTILVAVLVIPTEVNKIVDLNSRRPYGGRYAVQKVVGSRFIIVSGNLSYRAVEDFLAEFFHPSHANDMRAFPLRVVIMAPYKPSFEMRILLANYKGRVNFIEGTPLKDADLERVSANVASAVFLMADHLAENADGEDASQILRTLSVHRYCGPTVRVIVEMLKPENQDNPIWDDAEGGIEIVCPESLCYQLLARSCQIKGISTFVLNLFKAGLTFRNPIPAEWMQQYYRGQQQEIYPVILPRSFHEYKLTFEDVAEIVYRKFQVILFGLDISIDGQNKRDIVLYPRQRVIEPNDVGLVIAEDLTDAENVSRFGEEPIFSWYSKLYKHCIRGCQTSYDKDDSLIQDVMRTKGKIDTGNGSSFGSDSSRRGPGRDQQKTGEGLMSFGLMKTGHRAQAQTQLREIVCASTNYRPGSENEKEPESLRQARCRGCSQSQETKTMYSLEEAMELAMQWPPLKKQEKPDRPILEKRADAIAKNLEERTMEVVKLSRAHVLVCIQGMWPINLFYFISHLRTPTLPNPPIVILHPNQPALPDWGCVGMFDHVYFVKGWPVCELDLVRAGVLQAEKVVILTQRGREEGSKDPTNEDSGLTPSSSATLDVENVLITATAERLLHPVRDRIIVELHEEIEIHYLRPKFRVDPRRFDPVLYRRNRSATFLFSPAYIEGKGFCSDSLTFLLYALFFNRNTVCITEKLISGGDMVETGGRGRGQVVHSKLDQIALPKAYEGQTFLDLFIGLLHEDEKLALGLYRPVGTHNSIVSYVYTNPPPHEILRTGDLVYVLH